MKVRTDLEMPEEGREKALDLIRDLASVAGDFDAVCDRLRRFGQRHGSTTQDTAILALVLTFGECMSTPTEPGATAPLATPHH